MTTVSCVCKTPPAKLTKLKHAFALLLDQGKDRPPFLKATQQGLNEQHCRGLQLVVAVDLVGTVDLGHVAEQVKHTAGVAPLVVVPGDELDEVVVEADAGLGVEDGAGRVTAQVGRDDVVLGVVEDA